MMNTKVMTRGDEAKLINELANKTLPAPDSEEDFYYRQYVLPIDEHEENLETDYEKNLRIGWALVRGGIATLHHALELMNENMGLVEASDEEYDDDNQKANIRYFIDRFKQKIKEDIQNGKVMSLEKLKNAFWMSKEDPELKNLPTNCFKSRPAL